MGDFVPENELEQLLLAAFGDPSRRPAFYRAFLEGAVLIMDATPLPPEDASAGAAPPPGLADLRIRMLQIDAVTYLPVFTSIKRIEAHGHREGHYLMIRTRALLGAVPDAPVIVNPGSTLFLALSRREIAALLDGTLFRSNDPEAHRVAATGLVIEPLRDPPLELMTRLVQLFRIREAVRAACIVSMRDAAAGETTHPLVGIEAGEGWDALLREVMEIIDTHGRPGEVVDVFPLDDRPFSARVKTEGRTFFQR